jgi:hypothetical protein
VTLAIRTTLAVIATIVVLPSRGFAQPWLPPAGTGDVAVVYHHVFVQDHLFSNGERFDAGHVRSQVALTDIEYGITDRVAIRAAIPYIATKYTGTRPHIYPGTPPPDFHRLDDGTTHAAFQDLRAEARYGLREFPVAIAPFVAVSIPTHDYEIFAHSAIGLGLKELQLGSYAGLLHGPFDIQGRAAFAFLESVIGRRRNRSVVDTEVGWEPQPNLRLSAFQAAQFSYGGVEIKLQELLDRTISSHDWWPHHDQLARVSSVNVGGGIDLRLTGRIALHAALLRTMSGRNGHAAKYGITAGTSWGFGSTRGLHATPRR